MKQPPLSEKIIIKQAGADMATALLSTKVTLPVCHGTLVNRQRLLGKLGRTALPLIVIHAPAGFGKTTLLTAWLATLDVPVAWLSLDNDDNDPTRFMRYLIASVATVIPGFGEGLDQILSSPQPPHVASLLPSLLQQIEASGQPLIIAFDDYHLIENTTVQQLLNRMVEQRPVSLYLALTSRTEPQLSLPRLRVRRQLAEVTEVDLRFTHDEAAEFLNRIAALSLSEDDIAVLAARTEGWIAGLQLAALSLDGEPDRHAFVRAFAGDDRYIMDYLTEEVLQRQSIEIKQFLLQTSILQRLNGPLCDAVTGGSQSSALLARLEQNNMFLIPLDNKRCWYRYHHLFADLLRHQLTDQVDVLHRRASQWLSEAGYPHEAIHHAFVCDDFEQAAKVLDQHGKRLFEEGQSPVLMMWYQRLPMTLFKGKPERTLSYVWSHFLGSGNILSALVDELQASLDAGEIDLTPDERRFIETDLALMSGFRALKQRQFPQARMQGERILRSCQAAGEVCPIAPQLLLAIAYFATGDLVEAERRFIQLLDQVFSQEYLIALNAAICGLAQTLVRQGRLPDARAHLNVCLNRLKEKGWDQCLLDTAWLHIGLADIAYETNQLDDSVRYLDDAMEAAKQDHWNTLPAMIAVRRAKIYQAKGDIDAARKCFAGIVGTDIQPALAPFFPDTDDDMLALQLRWGDLSGAESWRLKRGLQVADAVVPEQETESILFVRLLLAQQQFDSVLTLIDPLLASARQAQRQGCVIELLILQALAYQSLGQKQQAGQALQQALDRAAPGGFVRVFLDEGGAMFDLLKQQTRSSYACALLAHLADKKTALLSKKELKTLELLVIGLSNKDIAERLFVSTNTVKSHIKNIYAKLAVNSRAQVIVKANALGLAGR